MTDTYLVLCVVQSGGGEGAACSAKTQAVT